MFASLATILLASTAAALPAAGSSQPCTDKSIATKALTIKDFEYHGSYTFSTPAHQIDSGFANFTLKNPNAGYTAVCSAYSTRLEDFFFGEITYNCTLPEGVREEATFTYARDSGALAVNQTWSCPGEGSRFWAQSSVKLDLKCTEKKWQNPNWKMGEIYSTRNVDCKKATVPAKVNGLQATL